MTVAGDMPDLVALEEPTVSDDGHGGSILGWAERFRTVARIRYLRGGETVQAARLRGVQPAVVTIRARSAAASVTPSWRLRDVRAGTLYAIRAVVRTEDRAYVEITAEAGAAP